MDLRNLRPCNVERGPRRVRRVDYARGSIKPRKLKPPVSTGNFFCNESMIFVPRIVPRRDSIFHFYCSSFVKKQNLFLTKSIIFNRFNALFSLNRIVQKFRVVFTISIKWQIHYPSSNIFILCKYIYYTIRMNYTKIQKKRMKSNFIKQCLYRNRGLKSPDPRRIGRFQGTWPTISGINRCRLDSNRLRYDNLLCLRTNNTILYFPRSKSSHECWLGWRGISLDAIVDITKQDIRGRLVRNYRRDIGRFARNYGYSGSIQQGSSMFLSRTHFEEFFFSAEISKISKISSFLIFTAVNWKCLQIANVRRIHDFLEISRILRIYVEKRRKYLDKMYAQFWKEAKSSSRLCNMQIKWELTKNYILVETISNFFRNYKYKYIGIFFWFQFDRFKISDSRINENA